MNKKLDVIKSIAVLVAICLVISAALAIVNNFTAPVIANAAAERETAARQAVMPDAMAFNLVENENMPAEVLSAYQGVAADGSTVGYVFTAQGKGFNGAITVMCAIDIDGKVVKCATLDVSGETSTLGGKTAAPEYTDQYMGTDATLEGVDAITGATVTSTAYESCVTNSFAAYELIKEAE